jgi:hypothetical protein
MTGGARWVATDATIAAGAAPRAHSGATEEHAAICIM